MNGSVIGYKMKMAILCEEPLQYSSLLGLLSTAKQAVHWMTPQPSHGVGNAAAIYKIEMALLPSISKHPVINHKVVFSDCLLVHLCFSLHVMSKSE